MTGDQPLALWPDEADVELPLDDATPLDPTGIVAALDERIREREALRNALADALRYIEDPRLVPLAERVRFWRTLVGRPAVVDDPSTPEERRDEGIARAAAKWTDEEAAIVDAAIRAVAKDRRAAYAGQPYTEENRYGLELLELTTADVWQQLDGAVPITKGIAGRMLAAKSAGIIANTGRTVIAPRESTGPNHGQRLTVWRAL